MAVANTQTLVQYVGNGSSVTAYPVPFPFLDEEWLVVDVLDAAGAIDTLTLGADYAVTGAGDPSGGEIVTVLAYDNTHTVTIKRIVPITQLLDLLYNDRLPAALLEQSLDKITFILQQLSGEPTGDRAIRFPLAEPAANTTLLPTPVLRRNSIIYFDATTGEMETMEIPDLITLLTTSGMGGLDGEDGLSAYELAVEQGFVGTVNQWLLTLVGTGMPTGVDAGDIAYFDGTDWVILAAPAAPGGNQQNILTHTGTAPSWITVDEVVLDYCDAGTPTTGTFLKL